MTPCILCGHDTIAQPAQVAPFIADYVFGGKPPPCERLFCPHCEFVFSSHRFSPNEMTRLYTGYRGHRYAAIRTLHEPDYPHTNGLHGRLQVEIDGRTAFAASIIGHQAVPIRRLLDYGGGNGQFIPRQIPIENAYVYDVSGVNSIAAPAAHAPYDLILCAHVMEHLPDPVAVLRELAAILAQDGAIYLEVPGYARLEAEYPDPRFHEHINHFTPCALNALVRAAGLKIVRLRLERLDVPHFTVPIMGALLRPAH